MKNAILFLLAILLFGTPALAQNETNTGTTYYQVTKLKNPEGNLMAVERTMMLPFFQSRVNSGKQLWHALYQVQSPSGEQSDFEYVSVDVFSNLTDLNLPPSGQNEVIAETFPHTTPERFWGRVDEVSDVVSVETYTLEGTLAPPAADGAGTRSQIISVNYMLVPPAMESDYLAMETEVAKPIMQEHLKQGRMQNWLVVRRMLPGGTDFGANFVTVDAFEDWAHLEAYNQEFNATAAKVHPGKDLNKMVQRINELRTMTRSEIWELKTETTPPTSEAVTYTVLKEGTGPKAMRGQEITWSGKAMDASGKTLFQTADLGENWQDCVGSDPYDRIWNTAAMMVGEGGIVQVTVPEAAQSYAQRRNNGGGVATFKLTVEKIGPPVKYGHDKLRDMLTEQGLEATKAWYTGLKRDNPEGYAFREFQMNALGYELMNEGMEEEAVFVLKTNCENYPNSYNTYDSLADAYSNAGNDYHAMKNFEVALQKNPESSLTAEKLSKLK
ncbi:hypothetical protein GGR28_002384 [Lewinella aquimaris]|uniref:Tetratricopeptide repeat protein n=1 Tax=Neolewinella aquimaris TaxID=1835722 RepID=A0A840E8V5_9BACT|nr:hypothetical protein [Neolewinella aquimaris]MBB4079757.1 hypothetical protein [Neolewinella aquimaris]